MPSATIFADRDTYMETTNGVDGGAPAGAGTTDQVLVRSSTFKANQTNSRAFFHFDLSSVPSDAIVSSGVVSLWWTSGNTHNHVMHVVTSAWTEANGGAQPSIGAQIGAWTVNNAQYFTVDITSTVQSWVSGALTNHGVRVKRAVEDFSMGLVTIGYYSREAGSGGTTNDPKIDITYNRPPGQPGAFTTPAAGEVVPQMSAYAINWGAATDPEGDAVTYKIEASSDGGSSYPTTVATGVSGTTTNWDTSPIASGSNYRLRVSAKDAAGSNTYGVVRESGVFSIGGAKPRMIVG